MRRPRLLFVQMGAVKQRRRQSREAGTLGVEANARRRLAMKTEQALPAGSTFPDEVVEDMGTDLVEVVDGMATCGGETGGVLLQGDCVDGILALLGAKALCRVMRTCTTLELRVGACSAWSKLGPATGQAKLQAWQMAVLNAVGVAPHSLPLN